MSRKVGEKGSWLMWIAKLWTQLFLLSCGSKKKKVKEKKVIMEIDYNCEDDSLTSKFGRATRYIRQYGSDLDSKKMLFFYGRYKQVNIVVFY